MKKFSVLLILLSLIFQVSYSQTTTMTSSGNWDTATRWSGSDIGDQLAETVIISNNVNPTIRNTFSYVVGNTTLNQNNTLTINSGGSLTIGAAGSPRNLTTNNNANLSIAGTLIIWGDLIVNNNLTWNISGTVIIKGNVILSNNSNISVSGNLTVDGDFTGGNNTNVSVSGSIKVGGDVDIGNGSNLNGCNGCFQLGGVCDGPNSFCNSAVLPVTLLFFDFKAEKDRVNLNWATATELNFDKFMVEKSSNGKDFTEIGSVPGSGFSLTRKDYHFTDALPFIGRSYYRLKAQDIDGYSEYFGVIAVNFTGEKNVVIYPNPVQGESLSVATNFSPSESSSRIEIYDNLGLRLMEANVFSPQTRLELGNKLKPGSYLLKYTSPNFSKVLRFNVK